MTETVPYEQNMVGGGEVMEVMMTGGDGGEMNEDTLAQVVNMLQTEGQLTGGNHTIIIRQPGSNEIQMIHTTNNGGELIVSKASEADIQALQSGNGILENVGQDLLEGQQGQMVMMDEGGNLVEGMVQMPEEESQNNVIQLAQNDQLQAMANSQNRNLIEVPKNGDVIESSEILECLVQMDKVGNQNFIDTALSQNLEPTPTINTKPITISTTTSKPKPKVASSLNGEVVSIKINTGLSRKKENKCPRVSPKNVIKISTVTGQQKYQPPKFHKCEACAINFVSKVAYMNHMDNCPSKRKSLPTPNKNNITYTCVFCETKFTSRLILMQHVRTCDKAKSSKNLSANSAKLKVTTSESKLKLSSSMPGPKSSKANLNEPIKKQNKFQGPSKFKDDKVKLSKRSILDPEDEPFLEDKDDLDSEYEDEKDIVYDDEDDINEEEIVEDDNIEEALANKRSQKHLGPIIVKGMFKCRDCSRTFSKEYQYNRHVKACTNAPLNTARIDTDSKEPPANAIPVSAGEAVPPIVGVKRKRGRPPAISKENAAHTNDELGNPNKKQAVGPKVVSVNPKKVGPVRGRPRYTNYSGNESDDEIMNYLSGTSRIKEDIYGKNKATESNPVKNSNSSTASTTNKIVKISPSDTLIKQTGRAILSKMNREKFTKLFKEMPFCGLCGDKFKSIQELSLHTQICHSEDLLNLRDSLDGKGNLSSVKCPLCDLHFVSPHILLLHMVSFHEKDLKSVQEELEMQNLNLVCPFCSEVSVTQDLLKEHLATRHLDKLINKPSNTVSPMTIDVHAFLKDKNNGSILPTSKLLKKEKVLCPECGLFFLKSYFEHHRCAAETYSLSARKFICSESQCSGLSFYKLIHLLTHLQQVHEKSLSCKSECFDSLTQFLDWLKKEESRTKMKYTKALQRMKQGKLSTVWICHRFHNAMRDPSSTSGDNEISRESLNRLNQCYSRIHAETSYNISTSRYDGKTSIRYYPDHRHSSDTNVSKFEPQSLPSLSASSIHENPTTSSIQTFTSEESAFSDAAELKQLLEDDEEFIGQKPKPIDNSFDAQQLARFEDLEKEVESVPVSKKIEPGVFTEDLSKDSQSQDSLITPDTSLQNLAESSIPTTLQSTVEKIINEESLPSSELSEEKMESKDGKEVNNLVALSAADLLLEKMLGEHDGGESSSVVTMETEEPHPSPRGNVQMDNLGPTEAKITDVDMLEAFGECITPEESSNSTISNAQHASLSSENPTEAEPESSQDHTELPKPQPEQLQPETQPEPEPELEHEPEQEPELEPEHEPEHEPELEPEHEPELEPEHEPEPQHDPEPEQVPIAEQQSSILEDESFQGKEITKKSEDENKEEVVEEEIETKEDQEEEEEEESQPAAESTPDAQQPVETTEDSNSQSDALPPVVVTDPSELESEQSSEIPEEKSVAPTEEEEEEDEEDDDDDDDDDEGEERTYVLPADLEEWSKLFEMVSAEVASRGISDEKIEEVNALLTFESQIMTLNEKKQIEIFNRLCSLANVQMT